MKRSALPRTTPLKRRKRLNPSNRKRKARLYERNFGAHSDFVRSHPCCVPGRVAHWGRIEAAHVTGTRGMGGCGADKSGLAPLCSKHHREQEGRTAAFEAEYGVDLAGVAARLWAVSPENPDRHEGGADAL